MSVNADAADAGLLAEGLSAIDRQLRAAAELLQSPKPDGVLVDRAVSLLRGADNALLALACAVTTDARTAGRLLALRDDLSGHLLAAVLCTDAGCVCDASEEILQRGVQVTSAGLRAIASPPPRVSL
jgi:hypothetical protein